MSSALEHDRSLFSVEKGIHTLKVTWVALVVTAVVQGVIVYFTDSAALLADTLHNVADAFTALPLWIAFAFERRQPNRRFTYGYSRFEDIAGIFIVVLIFITAGTVAYESYRKFEAGVVPHRLSWVAAASIFGFFGNEWVARYRIRVGKEINSAALIADGHHARADSLTSLGVLVGVIGVYFGFPLADPIVGLLISLAIVHIGWHTGKHMLARLADAVSPEMVDVIFKCASRVKGVLNTHDIRARYVGRHLRIELTVEVDGQISVVAGHDIAIQVQRELEKEFPMLVSPAIHIDPEGHTGEDHHYEEHHRQT